MFSRIHSAVCRGIEGRVVYVETDISRGLPGTSIVGLAVTEVDGVARLTGDITRELVAKLGTVVLTIIVGLLCGYYASFAAFYVAAMIL